MKETYTDIKNKYLAEALAFLNFKYFKYGFGRNTRYSFKETEEFKLALHNLLQLKEEFKNT